MTTTPPGYRALRGLLIGIVVVAFVAFGALLAFGLPTMAGWVTAAVRGLHQAWLAWHWRPL